MNQSISAATVIAAMTETARRRREQVLELKQSGKSNREIRLILGVSRQRVHAILKQAVKDKKRVAR